MFLITFICKQTGPVWNQLINRRQSLWKMTVGNVVQEKNDSLSEQKAL